MNRVFESHVIKEATETLGKINFDGKQVAIITPTIDESGRDIAIHDPALYDTQRIDASYLMASIAGKQKDDHGRVKVFQNFDEVNDSDDAFDYLIFLHEFMDFEHGHVLEALRENNRDLTYIELY